MHRRTVPSVFLLLALLVVVPLSFAQSVSSNDVPLAAPQDHGFDEQRLRELSEHFQSRINNGELAGMVILVSRNGHIVFYEALGYQDLLNKVPMERDTIFRIYSMTKPIASTALMMLYQDGAFQLTDPLDKFIPEFKKLTVLRSPDGALSDVVELEQAPTIQDALRHTAGFAHGLGRSEYDKTFVRSGIFNPETSLEDMMRLLSDLPLMNQPGAQWRYGVGHDIALRLVEIISGMSADDFLAERLFEVLEMNDTGYWVDADDAHRFGPVYYQAESGALLPIGDKHGAPTGGVLVQPWSVNSYTDNHAFTGGSFGLVSTAQDYWRFAQAILDNGAFGGARIIAPDILQIMNRNHLGDMPGFWAGAGMGLAFGIAEEPTEFGLPFSKGTLFWGGAAGTTFWIDSKEQLIVVGMTQHMATPVAKSLQGELAALVYAALTE